MVLLGNMAILFSIFFILWCVCNAEDPWYGNSMKATRFSPLIDVTPSNVHSLVKAWDSSLPYELGNNVVPIITDDGTGKNNSLMVLCTSRNELIAIDPANGNVLWNQTGFRNRPVSWYYYCRGVSSWLNPSVSDGHICRRTIFMGTLDLTLVAVDAATGKPCPNFGTDGAVQCWEVPINNTYQDMFYLNVKGPPVIVNGVVAVAPMVRDGYRQDSPKGPTWAFDAITGERKWTFNAIPLNASDPYYDTWLNGTSDVGGSNAWGMMSGDDELGLIFMPIGAPSVNVYGGFRVGINKHSTSLVAVNATTGSLVWGFQVVHHDIWAYDVACQPTITTVNGKKVVAFGTKTGFVYTLDAQTGNPVHEVEEIAVPGTDVPGEWVNPTQPVPKNSNFTFIPLQFDEQTMLWGSTEQELQGCKNLLANFTGRQEMKMFTPPSLHGSIMYPDPAGGINFHGCAAHPEQGTLLCAYKQRPFLISLFQQDVPYPSWCTESHDNVDIPYKFCMGEFRSGVDNNFFCSKPPWGLLTMVNISSGELLWTVPLGWQNSQNYKKEWGSTVVSGAPLQTASGVIFITGTGDSMLHIFDAKTGTEVNTISLPCPALTTPITYRTGGKQFIVVTCPNGHTIAYALPPSNAPVPETSDLFVVIISSVSGFVVVVIAVIVIFYCGAKKSALKEEVKLVPTNRVSYT